MKIDPDDPILTDYVLGELDETTRAAVEEALDESPACRQAVQEILRTANTVTHELAAEPRAELSVEQRQAINGASAPEQTEIPIEMAEARIVGFPWRQIGVFFSLAAASVVLVLALAHFYLGPRQRSSQNMARLQTEPAMAPQPTAFHAPPADLNEEQAASAPIRPGESASADSNSQPPSAGQTPGTMDPQLMRRYGLVPLPTQSGDASPPPKLWLNSQGAPTQEPGRTRQKMSPELLRRYGLTPSSPVAGGSRQGDDLNRASTSLSQGADPSLLERYNRSGLRADSGGGSVITSRYRTAAEARHGTPGDTTASYPQYVENAFLPVLQNPLSTFSIDVDTASYANVRRFLNQGQLPPRDAVRIEEMLNYFPYHYPKPRDGELFAVDLESAGCPWNARHRLVRIALKGRELASAKRPPSNLVFLIDVSGSMQPRERLPLIKQALRLLVRRMTESDRVAIVVYANNSGLALRSTSGADKEIILAAIDRLEASGSTNGGEGIQQAYAIAKENFLPGGVNRVILATDGDFNVGITDQSALTQLIQEKARSGVFLSALGVGTDNYKDALLQNLADKGNGNYHYLDTIEEAQKVLLDQMSATLVTIAKDVKIQIEFNPAAVGAYRLIGYEKRLLRTEDFNDDTKDAGEIGAGHAVTALYELVPAGVESRPAIDNLKYQPAPARERRTAIASRELLTLKLRYKSPGGYESQLQEFTATDRGVSFGKSSSDFKFAAAVAAFAMLLRDSEHKGTATFEGALELAHEGKGTDEGGHRAEFINLVQRAKVLKTPQTDWSRGQPALENREWIRRGLVKGSGKVEGRNTRLAVPLTREAIAFHRADPAKTGDFERFVTVGGEFQATASADKIVVNIAGTNGGRFAVARLSVLGEHPDLIQRMNENRERLIDVAAGTLSSKTLDDIEKPGFRNILRAELVALFNQVLGAGTIQEVVITEWITQ